MQRFQHSCRDKGCHLCFFAFVFSIQSIQIFEQVPAGIVGLDCLLLHRQTLGLFTSLACIEAVETIAAKDGGQCRNQERNHPRNWRPVRRYSLHDSRYRRTLDNHRRDRLATFRHNRRGRLLCLDNSVRDSVQAGDESGVIVANTQERFDFLLQHFRPGSVEISSPHIAIVQSSPPRIRVVGNPNQNQVLPTMLVEIRPGFTDIVSDRLDVKIQVCFRPKARFNPNPHFSTRRRCQFGSGRFDTGNIMQCPSSVNDHLVTGRESKRCRSKRHPTRNQSRQHESLESLHLHS